MDGSDKKLENLKKAIAATRARKNSRRNDVPDADETTSPKRNRSNPGVNLQDPEENVRRYGRQFTAPKGRKGTSYSMGRKRGK
jgi:Mg-chelatase subunit ChlI